MPDQSSAQQAMQTLNAQWYNALTSACDLDRQLFQLVQGSAPLGSTSEDMWNVADVVPPLSTSNFFNPSQMSRFSFNYGAVINNLIPQNTNAFQNAMGGYYSQWVAYLKTSPTVPNPGGMVQLFQNWSQMNMPPREAQTAYIALQQEQHDVVLVALQMWLDAGGVEGGTKAYNATIDQLTIKLASAPSCSVHLDSQKASNDVSHTWAKADAGLTPGFFVNADASLDQLTTAIASAGLTLDASFTHLLAFPVAPLAKPSQDPNLSKYKPWYSPAALSLAYHNNDNTVWDRKPPTWNDTFGPTGNMLSMMTALIVVDGIDLTTTSKVAFSSDQQTNFKAAAKGGIFPFFIAEGSGGWKQEIAHHDDGSFTVTSSMPTGNPIVIGVLVMPIGQVLM